MKTPLTMLAVLAVFPAGAAFADDDDCYVSMADNGWDVRRIKIDDGCYEIEGRDAQGREIEVTVHPQTLAVIEFEYEDDYDEDDDDDDDGYDDEKDSR